MAGELLELVIGEDPKLRAKVTARVYEVIAASFREDKSRATQSEAKRRFHIIEKLIRELRSDHGWAFERILDALPIALRSRLDGIWWDPATARNVWAGRTG
jgi:hypothetical protein